MSTRVIVTSVLLIIIIVLPSETIKLSKGTRGQVTFLQNVLQKVGEVFNKFLENMLNVNDMYNLTSSDEIRKIVSDVDSHFNDEIVSIERTIEEETASLGDERESLVKKLRRLVDDMKASVEYCEGKYESIALRRSHDMLDLRNFLIGQIDDHKTKFNACIVNCTSAESCTRAIVCMGWTAFVACADVRPGADARQAYSSMVSQQKQLLDDFYHIVRSCLALEVEYRSVKQKIFQSLADASKCGQVQSQQHPASTTPAPVSSVEESIS